MLFLQSSPQRLPRTNKQKLRVSLPSSRPLQVFHEHFVSALPQKRPNRPIPSDLPTQYPGEGCRSSSRADRWDQKTAAAKKRLRFLEEVVLTNILMDAYRIFPVKLRNQCPDGEMMVFLSNSDDESVVKIAVDYQKTPLSTGFNWTPPSSVSSI